MSTASEARPNSRKARAAETRRRLVAAAVDLFSEQHFDDVAVSDIAARAGVANGLLFHYFDGKRGIYLEAMRAAAAELDFVHEIPADLPAGRQFRLYFQRHLEYFAGHRGLALRLLRGGRGSDPEAWAMFETGRQHVLDWAAELFELDPRSAPLQMMLRSLSAAFDEMTVQWLEQGQALAVSAMVEEVVALAITCLQSAQRFDPALDVAPAVRKLRRR